MKKIALTLAAILFAVTVVRQSIHIDRLESTNTQIIKGCQILTAILQQEDARISKATNDTHAHTLTISNIQSRLIQLEHPPVITNPQWQFNLDPPTNLPNLDLIIPNDTLRIPKDPR